MIFRRKFNGYTLVEVLIASVVFTLFMGGALSVFFHSQKTINKASWINSAARDEGLALRRLSELAGQSSYPSTLLENTLKIAEDNISYKARLPTGTGNILCPGAGGSRILAFPVCSEQRGAVPGKIFWVILSLIPSVYTAGQSELVLEISQEIQYSPGPPDYVESMAIGAYSNSLVVSERDVLLKNIEETHLQKAAGASDTLELSFTQVFPDNREFRKKVRFSVSLNVALP